jgi:DNA-directed RNA polymerase specialized sigma24 family protein
MTVAPLSAADRQLWQHACQGDVDARQQLIERMWQLCRHRLRPFASEERQEIEQNMATSMLRALGSGVVPNSNLDGLLEWRGRGEITAFVRGRIRDRQIHRVDDALEQAGHEVSPFEATASAELHVQLLDCIARIPNGDHREAVHARLVLGLTPTEVAARRNAKPGAVRVWLTRGATLVRACLETKFRHHRGA